MLRRCSFPLQEEASSRSPAIGWRGKLAAALLACGIPLLIGAQSAEADLAHRLLTAHNEERAGLQLAPLRWNAHMAADAGRWADTLASSGQIRHANGGSRSGQGENLWIGTAGGFAPEAMVASWASEKAHFRRGRFPQVSTTGNWADVGHYTQMVWGSTDEVGCAVRRGAAADVLVCRYRTPGNVSGQAPF